MNEPMFTLSRTTDGKLRRQMVDPIAEANPDESQERRMKLRYWPAKLRPTG